MDQGRINDRGEQRASQSDPARRLIMSLGTMKKRPTPSGSGPGLRGGRMLAGMTGSLLGALACWLWILGANVRVRRAGQQSQGDEQNQDLFAELMHQSQS